LTWVKAIQLLVDTSDKSLLLNYQEQLMKTKGRMQTYLIVVNPKLEQAGTEVCKAQVKLG
jgi:hypothetical protein